MSEREQRTWTISVLPEAHLVPDAVVAFVDGELSMVAHDRVAAHIARCSLCAAETAAQRQARAAVRAAEAPRMPAGLLAALRAIPSDTDLPSDGGDRLAMTPDGQLVAVQRPDRAAFGAGPMLGSSTPLGSGGSVLRTGTGHGRRAVQGAGVVAAGLMLGALAVVGPHVIGASSQSPREPSVHGDGAASGDVVQANFSAPLGGGVVPRVPSAPDVSRFAHVRVR
ncbi:MAG TPA: zf-HC2 domain-containing protein [Pseudonocardiaceae bacterium]|jgi:anti-sigma factor RsiW|nr:zf-HC2 domain-containing protein [Pseudonocardiaceae bacterium]